MPPNTRAVRVRHGYRCRSRDGGRCNCTPKFEAHVYVARDDKKLRRVFTTREEALRWRVEQDALNRVGALRGPVDVSMRELAAEWHKAATSGLAIAAVGKSTTRRKAFKPSTARTHWENWAYWDPAIGARRVNQVNTRDLQNIVNMWMEEGKARATISNRVNALRAIWRFGQDRGVLPIAMNPCDRIQWDGPKRRVDFEVSVAHLLDLIDAIPGARWRAFYGLACHAGLRAGEIQGLMRDDIDFAAGRIAVRRSWDPRAKQLVEPKTEAGRRVVVMTPLLRDLLLDYFTDEAAESGFGPESIQSPDFGLGSPEGEKPINKRGGSREKGSRNPKSAKSGVPGVGAGVLVFPGRDGDPPSTSSFYSAAYGAWDALGLERVGLHKARHAFVSMMIAAGLSVKEIQVAAGHGDVSITLGIYGHLLDSSLDEQSRRLEALWTGASGAKTGANPSDRP